MGAGVVMLREGFEAALIVGILLAFLNRTNRRDAFWHVWAGTAAAIAASVAIAAALFAIGAELEGRAEAIWEGTIMLIAAGMLTWMVFWMRSQARTIRTSLEGQVKQALQSGSAFGLALVAFIGVLREGVESALFLVSSVQGSSPVISVVGATVGTSAAVGLGYLFYKGSARLDLRRFFSVTSGLLIVFAAWMFVGGVAELGEAGVVPGGEAAAAGAIGVLLAGAALWAYYRKPRSAAVSRAK